MKRKKNGQVCVCIDNINKADFISKYLRPGDALANQLISCSPEEISSSSDVVGMFIAGGSPLRVLFIESLYAPHLSVK